MLQKRVTVFYAIIHLFDDFILRSVSLAHFFLQSSLQPWATHTVVLATVHLARAGVGEEWRDRLSEPIRSYRY